MSTETPPNSVAFSELRHIHTRIVSGKRTSALGTLLAAEVPLGLSVLDIGCGDGTIASLLLQQDPSLRVRGLEVSARPKCSIDYKLFDGVHIPHEDASFDVCMFVDVLHHATDPVAVLREAVRVSRRFILIKDHLCENRFDWWTLKFMDWMGNRPHGVAMTYDYKSRSEWRRIFDSCGLKVVTWNGHIRIHAFPLNLLFGRGLHVVTLLEKRDATHPA